MLASRPSMRSQRTVSTLPHSHFETNTPIPLDLTKLHALLAESDAVRASFDARLRAAEDAFAQTKHAMKQYKDALAREMHKHEQVRREVCDRIGIVERVINAQEEEEGKRAGTGR
jgi:hypothetical protein